MSARAYAFGHYTHEKNPVTARAALTTIQIIEEEDLVENAAKVGASALARLHDMKCAARADRRRARASASCSASSWSPRASARRPPRRRPRP